ncbi:hypothetical protein BUALT_Bualt07G0078000 [Buddleja alternifolia]|uniref:Zinc finger GRF-type domain-containing protein n=1 Tax=Buddleja alternifolia TaxID=168488 RepID=A0AAV6X9Y5_9LAMI|nr:hypothetical protein BUALT_Bualt07G0078000 [Buddleja alternifolia]
MGDRDANAVRRQQYYVRPPDDHQVVLLCRRLIHVGKRKTGSVFDDAPPALSPSANLPAPSVSSSGVCGASGILWMLSSVVAMLELFLVLLMLLFCEFPCHILPSIRMMKTSWTNDNPGRRFLICERIECGKFMWWDPPTCSRSKAIIPGLLRRLNRHEDEMAKVELKMKKYKRACLILSSVLLLQLVWILFG